MTIVGVMMVKNEDRFIGAALRNVADFCDRMIIIDTGSSDHTLVKIEAEIAWGPGKQIDVFRELKLRKTHTYVEPFVGTDTWVFGVDGDEVYDPEGLRRLRIQLLDGELGRSVCQIKGFYLHVTALQSEAVAGYKGPPSHNPTKLYNFANIERWPNDAQHSLFHPKTRKVKSGCGKVMQHSNTWETAALRCLHMRFIKRSSLDGVIDTGRRLTPEDQLGYGAHHDRGGSDDVNERLSYRQGPLVSVPIEAFGKLEI